MSLLREIQASLMQQDQSLGPILLKLRFLASRLGSGPLEEWVKHESEGYPKDVEVPDYRKLGVSYTATFSGPLGSGIRNAPIPSYLIEKRAGANWTHFEMRQSVAAVDDLMAATKKAVFFRSMLLILSFCFKLMFTRTTLATVSLAQYRKRLWRKFKMRFVREFSN